jgi:hypothetical protein
MSSKNRGANRTPAVGKRVKEIFGLIIPYVSINLTR